MATTTLHSVFTGSGAGCLVQALRKAGRDDQVIAHFEELNVGPIDPADPSQRMKWLEDKFGRETWRYRGKEERV